MRLRPLHTALPAGAAMLLLVPGASWLYEGGAGESCARCHEIRATFDTWHRSSHREVNCKSCHGDLLTLDAGFHLGNLRRLATHLRGQAPEQIQIRNRDVSFLMERCRKCHQQEFAAWRAGPHGATYADLFLDEKHNRSRLLQDDCLRCHGMHFDGSMKELVTPVSTAGPWKLVQGKLAGQPAIPCLACHQIHREGQPLGKGERQVRKTATGEETARPSLAFFDRRGGRGVTVRQLPLPAMREGSRLVKMSPDLRQTLCYQCHAPLAGFEAGSGDDRTATGVHEGIGCLGCHQKHGQQTRASCANCHPRLSDCGLDVEKMDTTFFSAGSKHNIHNVRCADCHPKGVKRRTLPDGRGSDFGSVR